jgi:hypothetical protein
LIFYINKLDTGTNLTIDFCKELHKPFYLHKLTNDMASSEILDWINKQNIRTLNIAGPREGSEPGIYHRVYQALEKIFATP